ncbi:fibroblast growth factor-binding protein 1 [Gouania willdenowi]|uniref:Fibroblast growth factor-binding protein 1-like n=1 Tax=Gouania willdenowi TaxID=441366 RepID=A0A8C5H3G8_GOUWI|nr:fibroblast growth factor-binding protein 1-like [Gouania willdenowi]
MQWFLSVAPWLLLAFLGQHVSLSLGGGGADSSASLSILAQRSSAKVSGRGKFSINAKMQCTWSSRDTGESVKIRVKCENPEARVIGGVTDMECDYNGTPRQCPGFMSNPRGFWKQVSRSFRKLKGKTCKDQRALVRAGMCKRAPRGAHFKLDIYSSVSSGQSGGGDTFIPPRASTSTSAPPGTNCSSSRGKHQKTAEEHCSSQWTSVCAFLLSILQSDDC